MTDATSVSVPTSVSELVEAFRTMDRGDALTILQEAVAELAGKAPSGMASHDEYRVISGRVPDTVAGIRNFFRACEDGISRPAPAKSSLTLRNVLERYRTTYFNLSDRTHRFYAVYLSTFEKWHGGPIPLGSLSDKLLLSWLEYERKIGHAARTVNGKRMAILVLWRAAFSWRMVRTQPGKIPRMKEPLRAATSWSVTDVGHILRHCSAASSEGWPESKKSWSTAHWQGLVLCVYDTSLRIGTLLRLPRSCADVQRGFLLVPGEFQKNGQDQLHRLHRQTCKIIRSLPPHELLFPWPKNVTDIWTDFRRILIAAKLPATRRDQFHRLRRTSYTLTYKHLGLAAASEHAGHSKDLSAIYLDRTQLNLPAAIDVLERPKINPGDVREPAGHASLSAFPDPSEFEFHPTRFCVRGHWVNTRGGPMEVLKALVHSPNQRCSFRDLTPLVCNGIKPPSDGDAIANAGDLLQRSLFERRRARVASCIWLIRRKLRRALSLPESFEPVPRVKHGNGGYWALRLPLVDPETAPTVATRSGPPTIPGADEWEFTPDGFSIRGHGYGPQFKANRPPRGRPPRGGRSVDGSGPLFVALRLLARAEGPVELDELAKAIYGDRPRAQTEHQLRRDIIHVVSYMRGVLRRAFKLSQEFDPVPCLRRGRLLTWAIYLPAQAPDANNGRMTDFPIQTANGMKGGAT